MSGYMDLRRPRVYRRSNVGLVNTYLFYKVTDDSIVEVVDICPFNALEIWNKNYHHVFPSINFGKNYNASISYAQCHVMLCFIVVTSSVDGRLMPPIYSNPSGLLHWHWGNHMIAPVPVKQPWRIWVQFTSTKPQQNNTKYKLCT